MAGWAYLYTFGFQIIAITGAVTAGLVSYQLRAAGLSKLALCLPFVLITAPLAVIEQTSSSPWLPDLTTHDCQLVRFVFGSLFTLCAFRMSEIAFGNTPGDSSANRLNWITYLTSSDAKRGKDGKPLEIEPGTIRARIYSGISHLTMLGLTSSILISSKDATPMHDLVQDMPWPVPMCAKCADDVFSIVVLWLVLAWLFDVDGLLLELKGFQQVFPPHNRNGIPVPNETSLLPQLEPELLTYS